MKKMFFSTLCVLFLTTGFAQNDSIAQGVDSTQLYLDQIEANLNYQKGTITLDNGIGTLNVPKGFVFLDGKQSAFVLHEIWGNPLDTTTLGMLVPEHAKVTAADSWAFIVTYEEMGYVKDDDADDIDYEELVEEMRSDMEAANEARKDEGYEPITLIGWASQPFYDKDRKVLHWAKELKFGDAEENTLNYNVRVLGRKGVLVLNAVGSMTQLAEIKNNINPVTTSFAYSDGHRYSDFNPEVDEIAAWSIGGLVAGKVLAKAGFFALILKNIKLIGLALIGVFSAGWKWFRRKTEPPAVKTIGGDESAPS